MQTQITVEYVILLLLNVSSFLQREREREKKGKKLISVFDRQFETQKLMQKIERQTHRERENIMSKNTFKIAQESPEKSILLKHEPIHYTRL